MKVTPDTLTETMVRMLYRQLTDEIHVLGTQRTTYDEHFKRTNLQYHCLVTMGEKRAHRGGSRARSRQRICDAINARAAKVSP